MKQCSDCLQIKSETEFHKKSSSKDGLMGKCKQCNKEKATIWKKNNPAKVAENKKLNPHPEHSKKWYESNKEKRKESMAEWQKENPAKCAAISSKRRSAKLKRTPIWISEQNLSEIEKFHIEAAKLTKETGINHEVDHIIPLQGENVSGLHVPWNLQIITKSENSSKGNRF